MERSLTPEYLDITVSSHFSVVDVIDRPCALRRVAVVVGGDVIGVAAFSVFVVQCVISFYVCLSFARGPSPDDSLVSLTTTYTSSSL